MKRHVVAIEGEDLAAPLDSAHSMLAANGSFLVIDAIGLGPIGRPAGLAAPDRNLCFFKPS